MTNVPVSASMHRLIVQVDRVNPYVRELSQGHLRIDVTGDNYESGQCYLRKWSHIVTQYDGT